MKTRLEELEEEVDRLAQMTGVSRADLTDRTRLANHALNGRPREFAVTHRDYRDLAFDAQFGGANWTRDLLAFKRRHPEGFVMHTTPVASNTLLTPPEYTEKRGFYKLAGPFAPLQAFSSLFALEPIRPRSSRVIKYNTTVGSTLVDATSFETGDGTLDDLQVTIHQYTQAWHVTPAELQGGFRSVDLFEKNMEALAQTLTDQVLALATTANFPANDIAAAASGFGAGEAGTAYGSIPGSGKALLLNSTAFGRMAAASGVGFNSGSAVHGWQHAVHEIGDGWTGTNYGLACNKAAIVVCYGTLEPFNAVNIAQDLIAIPGIDLIIEHNQWFNAQKRELWRSLDCVFGCAVGDSAAGVVIHEP